MSGLTAQKATYEWQEYRMAQRGEDHEQDEEENKQGAGIRGTTPERRVIKINTDAALSQRKEVAGWGIVARDDSGKLVSAWAGKKVY